MGQFFAHRRIGASGGCTGGRGNVLADVAVCVPHFRTGRLPPGVIFTHRRRRRRTANPEVKLWHVSHVLSRMQWQGV